MAYIRKFNSRWQAQVQINGVRKSKLFNSIDEAENWSSAIEDSIQNRGNTKMVPETASEIALLSSVPTRVLKAISSVPYSRLTILSAAIPCSDLSGIYFLIDGVDVVYVGKSVNILRRIARHMEDGRRFKSYAFITCPESELDRLEDLYITALMPEWNVSLGRHSKSAYPVAGTL